MSEPTRPQTDDDWEGVEMSEEEVHALPDYTALTAAYDRRVADTRDMTSMAQFFEYTGRIAHPVAIEHFGQHQIRKIAVSTGFPPPLLLMFEEIILGMWTDGFLIGTQFQSDRDLELASVTIPDSPEGLT